jgi:hypothetical protein
MRKFLITLLILVLLIIGVGSAWIFAGRQASLMFDRFNTVQTAVTPVDVVSYEGSGTGGILYINDIGLSVSAPDPQTPSPEIGTTKDGQLALSFDEKVFPFGPLQPTAGGSDEKLGAARPKDDRAFLALRHSALAWPTPFDFNFMSGQSPSWRRHQYYHLTWTKPGGAKLEMLWRYEQYFYPGQGWTSGLMTRQGETGLIRVDIANAAK